jgi:hypothetical protein
VPTSSYTYLVPAAELENSNPLQQGYETCAISTSASLANLARAEGFEPPSSALETDSLTLSLRPHFPEQLSKSNKKPGARPGPVHKQTHSDPQHTVPQMTRLVILVITRLKVFCISHTLKLKSTSLRDSFQVNLCMDRIRLQRLSLCRQVSGDAEY